MDVYIFLYRLFIEFDIEAVFYEHIKLLANTIAQKFSACQISRNCINIKSRRIGLDPEVYVIRDVIGYKYFIYMHIIRF
jgi:hypothetical protein